MAVARVLLALSLAICASSNNEGWFWHVTDFHHDFSYWGRMLSRTGPVTSRGIYGNYWLDSPWLLVKDSILAMKDIKSDVDFILWTGDSVAHIKDEDLSLQINMDIMRNITVDLKASFPNTTCYASLGNHDFYPNNQAPPNNAIFYNLTADLWGDWIKDGDQLANFRKGGYYTLMRPNNIRILVLNTNLYYTSNKITPAIQDPADQFAWMESVLQSASNNDEKVIVTAHIPPGVLGLGKVMWFYLEHNRRFLDIMKKYSDVIVAMHYGHEHTDSFKVYYKEDGTPKIPIFIAPSVTPWRFKIPGETGGPHNPGIRLVKYDRTTGRQLDLLQYYLDLPESNAANKTSWKLEYAFREAYGVPDISAASMDGIAKRIKTETKNGKAGVGDKYYMFHNVNATQEGAAAECSKACKGAMVCGFAQWADMETLNKCLEPYLETGSGTKQTTSLLALAMLLAIGRVVAN